MQEGEREKRPEEIVSGQELGVLPFSQTFELQLLLSIPASVVSQVGTLEEEANGRSGSPRPQPNQ